MASPTEIAVPQLSRLIGTPDCPVLVDLRIEEDFAADPDRHDWPAGAKAG